MRPLIIIIIVFFFFIFFFTYEQAYASLEDLINQNARELNLISACLGSRFSALFVEQSISGYVQ
jgi:hypothetical protein